MDQTTAEDNTALTHPPRSVDWIIDARWIATVDPQDRLLEHHSIVIQAETIVDLLPTAQVRKQYSTIREARLENHIITPGFINAHCHGAMTLFRGFADDLPLEAWLESHIWPAESTHVSAEFVLDGSLLAIAEMLSTGTTCIADMYFFPEQTVNALTMTGMRGYIAPPVFDFPSNWQTGPDDYLAAIETLNRAYADLPNVTIAIGPHAPYTVSDETFGKVLRRQHALSCNLHIHAHETDKEIRDSLSQFGKRPLARLNDLGVLSPKTQCVHMTQVNAEDIALLTDSQASVVHCPRSNLKLASGFCPVDQLLKHDITVALGTDGAASNNQLNMMSEMQMAALLAKPVASDASAVSASQALKMATLNGAKALGLDHQIGSIEIGKQADLTAIKLDHLSQAPVYSPLSALVYATGGHQVSDVWIAGQQKLARGILQVLDINQLQTMQRRWQRRIANGPSQ